MNPSKIAQYIKAGRGFLVTRHSATLADTDYERVAKEIVSALNDRTRLVEALKGVLAMHCTPDGHYRDNAGAMHAARELLKEIE